MAAFVTVLLCANLIGAAKVAQVRVFGTFTFGAGILFFPISYIFGDVLTEVYGYARSRKVVWAGFGALIFASFMSCGRPRASRPRRAGRTRPPSRRVFGSTLAHRPRVARRLLLPASSATRSCSPR